MAFLTETNSFARTGRTTSAKGRGSATPATTTRPLEQIANGIEIASLLIAAVIPTAIFTWSVGYFW